MFNMVIYVKLKKIYFFTTEDFYSLQQYLLHFSLTTIMDYLEGLSYFIWTSILKSKLMIICMRV